MFPEELKLATPIHKKGDATKTKKLSSGECSTAGFQIIWKNITKTNNLSPWKIPFTFSMWL